MRMFWDYTLGFLIEVFVVSDWKARLMLTFIVLLFLTYLILGYFAIKEIL